VFSPIIPYWSRPTLCRPVGSFVLAAGGDAVIDDTGLPSEIEIGVQATGSNFVDSHLSVLSHHVFFFDDALWNGLIGHCL